MTTEVPPGVGILGAGRAGLGLAFALQKAGVPVCLHSRRAKPAPAGIPLTGGTVLPSWVPDVDVILLAVPDGVIADLAAGLAASGQVKARHAVLHLSGVLDAGVLVALGPTGAALGSLHPLLSFSDPHTVPLRLPSAIAAVEGDERAQAVASDLARRVGLTPFPLPAEAKARYHAGAVFGANFLVTVADAAHRIMQQAGVPAELVSRGLATLMGGALDAVMRHGPASALTGPLKRGDAGTVRRNVAALGAADADLYRALGRATLDLAGLDPETRQAVEAALDAPAAE